MKLKVGLLLFLVALLAPISALAEEWPTLPLPNLVRHADTIFQAKFHKTEGPDYFFAVKGLNTSGAFSDTVVIKGIPSSYNTRRTSANGRGQWMTIDQSDELLLFVAEWSGKEVQLVFSGLRLLAENRIYQPFQWENPGIFYWTVIGEDIAWRELLLRTKKIKERIDAVLDLKKIALDSARNRALFHWIEENRNAFGKQCTLNEDCGWGGVEGEIFEWIVSTGITHDSWKANLLGHELCGAYMTDLGKPSFATPSGRGFLQAQALNDTVPFHARFIALRLLRENLWMRYPNARKYPDLSSVGAEEQNEMLEALFPLLSDSSLRRSALAVVSQLSNPRDANLKERINLKLLPKLVEKHQKEPPSDFRNELGSFLAYNMEASDWKALTGNDERLHFAVYHLYQDLEKGVLKFNLRRTAGHKYGNPQPLAVLQRLEDGQVVETVEIPAVCDYCPANRLGGSSVTMQLELKSLAPGKWQFRVTGTAGDQDQYEWTSEPGQFVLPEN